MSKVKNGIEKITLFLFINLDVNFNKSMYDKTLFPPTSIFLSMNSWLVLIN